MISLEHVFSQDPVKYSGFAGRPLWEWPSLLHELDLESQEASLESSDHTISSMQYRPAWTPQSLIPHLVFLSNRGALESGENACWGNPYTNKMTLEPERTILSMLWTCQSGFFPGSGWIRNKSYGSSSNLVLISGMTRSAKLWKFLCHVWSRPRMGAISHRQYITIEDPFDDIGLSCSVSWSFLWFWQSPSKCVLRFSLAAFWLALHLCLPLQQSQSFLPVCMKLDSGWQELTVKQMLRTSLTILWSWMMLDLTSLTSTLHM